MLYSFLEVNSDAETLCNLDRDWSYAKGASCNAKYFRYCVDKVVLGS